MIGRLTGTLIIKQPPELLLDVAGVGYEVAAPMSTFYQLPEVGENVTLHTHLVVREDAHTMYGFSSVEQRTLFRTLIKVNGVGPKLALTILSSIEPDLFVQSVMNQDAGGLTRIPGIGKKTAERLIVEMRDRLKDWDTGDTTSVASGFNQVMQDAMSALEALGYKSADSMKTIKRIAKADMKSEEMIRLALQGMMG